MTVGGKIRLAMGTASTNGLSAVIEHMSALSESTKLVLRAIWTLPMINLRPQEVQRLILNSDSMLGMVTTMPYPYADTAKEPPDQSAVVP